MAIVRRLASCGHVAYLAGGCVRDRLLGREPKDFDVATDATPDRIVELFRHTRKVGMQFGVVLVKQGRAWVEVATFRSDVSYSDGRHPDAVVFGSAEEDAKRRDFTVNGMFYDPREGRVVDCVGGQADLDARLLRAIGEPARRFQEDHLRMLRAVRLAAELGFTIDTDTYDAVLEHAELISRVSSERIREELSKLLAVPGRGEGLRRLWATGLLPHLWDGSAWSVERAEASAALLDRLPETASFELALAGMLIPFARTELRRICRALTCSNAVIRKVVWLRDGLERLRDERALELAELKQLMAGPAFDDLIALWRARRAGYGQSAAPCDELVSRARGIPPEQVRPPPLITGDDLIEQGYAPGPAFSRVLRRVYTEQLNDRLKDRASALALAERLLAD